jgi:hypothetical protein
MHLLSLPRAGIAQWHSAWLRAGWSGIRIPTGAGNFSLHHCVQTDSGVHPRALSLGIKRPGVKADHSSPSTMHGAIPPLPQYVFMAWCSIKKAQRQLYLFLIPPMRASCPTHFILLDLFTLEHFCYNLYSLIWGSCKASVTLSRQEWKLNSPQLEF